MEWATPLSEQESVADTFYIIIQDYYTPATPDGDDALLETLVIRPMYGGDGSDIVNVYVDEPDLWNQDYPLFVFSKFGATLTGNIVEYRSTF